MRRQARTAALAKTAVVAAAIAGCLITPVLGQAETAGEQLELGGGGLLIVPSATLSIEQMDVHLRPDRVRVSYLIRNGDERPRTVLISFPLPDIDLQAIGAQRVSLPLLDPANFVAATLEVDDVPVSPAVEQRALALGIDISETLSRLDLPLFPFAPNLRDRLAALPRAARVDLEERSIIAADGERFEPLWTVKTARHWRQTFQPAATTRLQLTYTPVLGMAPITASQLQQRQKSHCLEPRAAEAVLQGSGGAGAAKRRMTQLIYLLGSGSVLPGPVARFRLVVERAGEADVAVLCRDGMQVTGARSLEWSATEFWPDEDVSVLFIE